MDSAAQFGLQSFSLVVPILTAGLVFIWLLRKNLFPSLDRPIDHGLRIRGRRVFGDNKTWRGVLAYTIFSIIACEGLWLIARTGPGIVHPLFLHNPLFIGLVFSLSYIFGELTNSFIKRQRGIAPGAQSGHAIQRLIDNIDGMVALALLLVLLFGVAPSSLFAALALGIALHALTDVVMKHSGLKQ